jgi:membrane fusion protein (multidrug efflux system)
MKKALISAIVCVTIAAVGVLIVFVPRPGTDEAAAIDTGNRSERIPNVRVQVLEAVELRDRLRLTGTIYPWEDVTIAAETSGRIDWKGVETGDLVSKGQELFRIDSEALRTSLEQAEAQARLAEQEHERIQRLLERGAGTRQGEDSAVANRDVASASLRATRIQLEKSTIRAPFDGVVDRVFQEQDEYVDPGHALVRLVQVQKVKVNVGIPERDVPRFRIGDEVAVRLDAYPDREFAGKIHIIAPMADLTTHTFTTEIALDNPDGCLMPGMIARAELIRNVYPESIVIPIFSAMLLDERRYVFLEREGIAELRPIEIGIVQGNNVQITDGLAPGDRLIVVGQRDVRPGEPVKVQEAAP